MEIKPVNPKGYQPKIFIAKTNAKAPILWPPDVTDLLEKTMFLRKIEGRKKGRQMRWLDGITFNGHEFEQTLGDGGGQGSLACCSPWGHKESEMIYRLNNIPRSEIGDHMVVLLLFYFFFTLNISLLLFFYFTILYWFCHTSTCIHHGCTRGPHPEPSSLPPHTIPLDHPSAPAPSFLYPASNLDWRFISYMILYMF